MKEEIKAERFTTADGSGMIAIWSTAPPREQFSPRQTTFAVNKEVGARPILVDPITGRSTRLATRPGPDGAQTFTVDVHDYPRFIFED